MLSSLVIALWVGGPLSGPVGVPMFEQEAARARELEKEASDLQRAGKYHAAEKPLLEAIGIWKQFPGPGDIEVLNDEMNLAVSYRRRGDGGLAVPILERVAAGLKVSRDVDAPDLYRSALNNLSAAYREVGRAQDALKTLEAVLAAIPDEGPSAERARVLDNLASVLLETEAMEKAEQYARRGVAEWKSLPDVDPVGPAISSSVLGTAFMRQGKLAEARPLLQASATTIEGALGEHPVLCDMLNLVAEAEARSGHRDVARPILERSLRIAKKTLPENHRLISETSAMLRRLGPSK